MILEGRPYPMEGAGRGWWFLDSPQAGHGTDYAFVVDGSDPLPDPRSPWQPSGVHGFSRMLDQGLFPWTDRRWQPPPLSDAVIYELHVGTFSGEGSFEGVIGHIGHIIDLGVTHIELMPVASFSGRHGWGYDGVDLYAPHEPYGGPQALKTLVNTCHEFGLAVILDVVYNHLGPEGNYLDRFGPYFTDRYLSPWGRAMNFDGPGSDEVRRFVIDNALMWLKDYHMDGLRLDAIHAIVDTSAVHILDQLSREVDILAKRLGRSLFLIAESNLNDPRIVEAREIGGYGIDAQWSDDFHHAVHAVLTGEGSGYYMDFGSLSDIAKAVTDVFVYDGRYSLYRQRTYGRPVKELGGERFVSCLQNHDQVGNRAKGERAGMLMDKGKLMIASALLFDAPFIPMIFQGEEWDASSPFLYFTDFEDQDLGRSVSEGRKSEFAAFGWNPDEIPDPQAESTFELSKLDWEEPYREPHASVLAWYRALIGLRRSLSDLKDGDLRGVSAEYDEDEEWIVITRGSIVAACNISGRERTLPLPDGGERKVLLSSNGDVAIHEGELTLPGETVVILKSVQDSFGG
jgi:maltooligosyltrehalose trehalohydrolase